MWHLVKGGDRIDSWDDACLYVGADLEEPQAWANLVRASSADYVAPSHGG
jgi:hypothetical protein